MTSLGQGAFVPRVALVLGSGLGNYADNMDVIAEISYSDIPGFPVSTAPGHDGKYILGYVGSTPLIAMKGRIHFYEGYNILDVVMPIRVMGLLGADTLIVTNAAGGIDLDFEPGDLMLIKDQILLNVPSPLIGPNIDELGVRFPDMSKIYTPELQELARTVAQDMGLSLKEGVYLQTSGPQFETPAEIEAYRAWGASAVGMSTGCETIAARHMGMKVAGISCISNMAAGILDQPLSSDEVTETAASIAHIFTEYITKLIEKIGTQIL